MSTKSEVIDQKEKNHKIIVTEFFKLIGQQKFKDSLKFFAPNCITHNPYIAGNMDNLTDAMSAANSQMSSQMSNPEFSVQHILADGDFVAVHTNLLANKTKPQEGGLRQIHLFASKTKKL
jgi:hypothetical protein